MTDLITAVREENLEKVKEILESNSVSPDKRFLIHTSCVFSFTFFFRLFFYLT